jgi:hypothetical protein
MTTCLSLSITPAVECPRRQRTTSMMNASSQERASASAGDVEAVAAWSARYREYLERSIARAGRAQDLNRELIKRVATGQLAPWTIENHLNTFAATRAASYSERIANITMAFLAGLIQIGSTYSYELVQAVLPGAVLEPEVVAPDFEPAKSADWFRDLTMFAAGENARATAMLRMVMDQVAAGELAPADVEQVSSKFHTEHVPNSTGRLVELYLDLLTRLEEVHTSFSEEYLRTVMGTAPSEAAHPDSAAEVDALLGEATSIRFAVTNTDLEPTVVACTLSGIRRADGVGPAFDPVVNVTPRRLELAPGAEATVELTIHADADHFQLGALYEGVFQVASATRTLLELPLRIRVMAPEPAPGPPDPPPPTAGETP